MKTVLVALFVVLCLAGCASPKATAPVSQPTPIGQVPKTPSELQPTAVTGAIFTVVKADGSRVPFTMNDLKKLPLGQVMVDSKMEEGPRLLDVLNAAGVSEFKQVTLSGSNGSMTLTREQVNDKTILDFTNRGTVKQSGDNVPKDQWIHDVNTITVE